MWRRCFVFAAIVMAPCLTAAVASWMVAQDSAAEKVTTKIVTRLVFNNGKRYDGKVSVTLASLVKPISEVCPTATFKLDGEALLLVGLDEKDLPRGEIFSVTHESNCPVNSCGSQQPAEIAGDKLKQLRKVTLVALTKLHHPGFENAEVQSLTKLDDSRWDVTLVRPAAKDN